MQTFLSALGQTGMSVLQLIIINDYSISAEYSPFEAKLLNLARFINAS